MTTLEKIDSAIFKLNNFPKLMAGLAVRSQSKTGQYHRQSFEKALVNLREGLEQDSIRNVHYTEAKKTIGILIEWAWQDFRTVHFERKENWEKYSPFYYAHPSLYTVSRLIKKLGTAQDAFQVAAQEFYLEILPLSQAITYLKSKAVKGRVSNPNMDSLNPNKVVRTCPCCFRLIAVVDGKMALHGYRKSAASWVDSSCDGIDFEPLERSCAVLDHMIKKISEALATHEQRLVNLRQCDELTQIKRSGLSVIIVKIKKEDRLWFSEFNRQESEISTSIWRFNCKLKSLKDKRSSWVKTESV